MCMCVCVCVCVFHDPSANRPISSHPSFSSFCTSRSRTKPRANPPQEFSILSRQTLLHSSLPNSTSGDFCSLNTWLTSTSPKNKPSISPFQTPSSFFTRKFCSSNTNSHLHLCSSRSSLVGCTCVCVPFLNNGIHYWQLFFSSHTTTSTQEHNQTTHVWEHHQRAFAPIEVQNLPKLWPAVAAWNRELVERHNVSLSEFHHRRQKCSSLSTVM